MITDTAVRLAIEDFPASQPIAVECPVCWAIVRKTRLVEHRRAIHEEQQPEVSE